LKASVRAAPVVTWNSVAGMTYRILRKSALTDIEWTPLYPLIKATGSTASFVDFEADTKAFYRVEVIL
jgi:hypothetical protein